VAEYTRSADLELSRNLAKAMSQLASRLDYHDRDELHLRRRKMLLDEMQRTSVKGDTDLEIASAIEMLSVS
jgi:hypothetical protein